MIRALLLSAVLYAPAALACPGEDGATADASHEGGAGCHMPSAEATTAALPKDGTHKTLAVDGMHCGACADKVKTALMGVDGVRGATVDHASGKVVVSFDDKKTNLDALVKAVNNTGFQAKIGQAPAPTVTN